MSAKKILKLASMFNRLAQQIQTSDTFENIEQRYDYQQQNRPSQNSHVMPRPRTQTLPMPSVPPRVNQINTVTQNTQPKQDPSTQKQVQPVAQTKTQQYKPIPTDIQEIIGVSKDGLLGPNTQRELDRFIWQNKQKNPELTTLKGESLYEKIRQINNYDFYNDDFPNDDPYE